MITERDTRILRAVARYYVVSRVHVQRLCLPNDRTGRATRRRLQMLLSEGLLNRTRAPIFNPHGGSSWPAYYPSQAGLEFVSEHFDDEWVLAVSCRAPEPYHLHHFLAITDTHIALDRAIATPRWQSVVCKNVTSRKRRFPSSRCF